ncbi:gliding motility lipoprotein GldH [Flavobacterium sp. N1994]|uniref:gliding motility lipoprotein GldH n=1 Tax=Flavobacterium sp. N1994 TaxID=2986827 RepID=UPI0022232F97|nr:gliding motility lipoprotein GldH [Flavobacterium sp. N1994]
MKTKSLLLIAFLFIVLSCNSSSTFNQFDKMPENNHWDKSDVKQYEFEIKDDTKLYNIVFEFSHVYDYQFASVPIQFSIESPDGKTENLAIDMPIRESDGKEIADCSGDVCDLKYRIKEKTTLSKGIYKITISQDFKMATFLPNVIGVGLNVDSVK